MKFLQHHIRGEEILTFHKKNKIKNTLYSLTKTQKQCFILK